MSEIPKRGPTKEEIFDKFLKLCVKPISPEEREKLINDIVERYGISNRDEEKKMSDEEEFDLRFKELISKPTHSEFKLSEDHKRRIESLGPSNGQVRRLPK
ncbi:Hypothetical protein CINCED_3A022354 [Cinara cedri]|uniref:Uncharacterized protein n=1 Tax=Cinara cedri TaxID=506608 RepID=A0A5E4MVY4_9HEMI|nr:Hypothetical protein CINCED_3A014417 [Cinara cedri]VVC36456.1 Hypothetical protein CINCED_3A022354 [Cinara cedri]